MSGGRDEVSLVGIQAHGFHGVLEHERRYGQRFLVDVSMTLDAGPAAVGDDLSLTVDYGEVAAGIVELVEGTPVNLIETLAHRIADACLARPVVEGVTVTVHKPQAPVPVVVGDVTVTVRRARADNGPAVGWPTDPSPAATVRQPRR